jgi:glycosyltransferase involved in cell wall biosynthesis
MRILVYCDEDLSVAAGGARQVVELAKALGARGHAVLVVAPQAAGEGRDFYDLGQVHVKCVSVVRRGGLRPLSFFLGSLKILSQTVGEWRPDVSVWFDSPGQMAPLWALRRHRCPYVYFVNGLPHEEVQGLWRRTPIRQLLSYGLCQAARSAQVVVSICPEVFAGLRHLEPVNIERCAVIRNGVDPDRFFPQSYEKARAELGLTAAGPYIGFVGGFFPWHGLDTLIESIPAVAKAYPGVQLLLVGDGQTKEALEHRVHRSHLSTHIRFVGRAEIDVVPTWIAASDVCVVLHKQTRSYPGDSMKLWEYLACGRPVVATAGPGYGDTVEALGCGLASEPDDPDDLARQLLCLLVDQELRSKMGERGRTAVLQSHTWAARAEQLEQACRQAITGVKPTL